MDMSLNMLSDELSDEIIENSKNKAKLSSWIEYRCSGDAIYKKKQRKINQKHIEIKEIEGQP